MTLIPEQGEEREMSPALGTLLIHALHLLQPASHVLLQPLFLPYSRFWLFVVVTFYKVSVNAELVSAGHRFQGKYRAGSWEPLVTIFS